MFGINLGTQPEIVQTAAGYLVQGWELAASWLLSPAAWSQFGLLVVAYLAAVLVARRLSPFLENLLNPGDSTNILVQPRRFVMQFLPLLLPLLAYGLTGIGSIDHYRSVPQNNWQIRIYPDFCTLCAGPPGFGTRTANRHRSCRR